MMTIERPPEGARWKIPDWMPHAEEATTAVEAAEPEPKPTSEQVDEVEEVAPVPPPAQRTALFVPLKLKDFKQHWGTLAQYSTIAEEYYLKLVSKDQDGNEQDPLQLTNDQRKELTQHKYTYLSLEQLTKSYDSGGFIGLRSDVWIELNKQGIVSSDDLTDSEIYNLQSIQFFMLIKTNREQIAKKKAILEKTIKVAKELAIGLFGVFGLLYLLSKCSH